jgi:hypothetical protein
MKPIRRISASNDYDGTEPATGGPNGVETVVVSINYRLGVLGTFSHPDINAAHHLGKLWARSTSRRGSDGLFELTLGRLLTRAPANGSNVYGAQLGAATPAKIHPSNLYIMQAICRRCGHEPASDR